MTGMKDKEIAAIAPNRRCRLFGKQITEQDWIYVKEHVPTGFHGLVVNRIEEKQDAYWLYHDLGVVSIGKMCGWVLHAPKAEKKPDPEVSIVDDSTETVVNSNFLGLGKLVKKEAKPKVPEVKKATRKRTTKKVTKK